MTENWLQSNDPQSGVTVDHTGESSNPRMFRARKCLALLDREVVPGWDFKLPPGEPVVQDSSALAVVICGLQELAAQGGQDSRFFHTTRPLLQRLCADDYLDTDENCRGLLRSAYGNRVAYSSWGDYFLMEAQDRELHAGETFW